MTKRKQRAKRLTAKGVINPRRRETELVEAVAEAHTPMPQAMLEDILRDACLQHEATKGESSMSMDTCALIALLAEVKKNRDAQLLSASVPVPASAPRALDDTDAAQQGHNLAMLKGAIDEVWDRRWDFFAAVTHSTALIAPCLKFGEILDLAMLRLKETPKGGKGASNG